MTRPTDSEIQAALSVLRADYYADVTDIAQDAISEVKAGNITDYEALDEYVRESVDGTQRVIYTSKAARGLLISSNDAAFEDMGISATKDGDVNWSGMMYAALLADVLEELSSEGYGYDEDEWPGAEDAA